MTKPAITSRTTKGAALTYSELDTNFTNLRDSTLTVTGDTGTITNNLNDSFKISGGTGLTSRVSSTTLIVDLDNTAVTAGSYTLATITVDAQGRITAASATNMSNYVTLDGTQTITGAKTFTGLTSLKQYSETVYSGGTVTSTYTPTLSNGAVQTITVGGNFTLNAPSGMTSGSSICIIITQDATGGRTMTANSSYKFVGGSKTLTTAANAVDLMTIFYDGSRYLCGLNKGYA